MLSLCTSPPFINTTPACPCLNFCKSFFFFFVVLPLLTCVVPLPRTTSLHCTTSPLPCAVSLPRAASLPRATSLPRAASIPRTTSLPCAASLPHAASLPRATSLSCTTSPLPHTASPPPHAARCANPPPPGVSWLHDISASARVTNPLYGKPLDAPIRFLH